MPVSLEIAKEKIEEVVQTQDKLENQLTQEVEFPDSQSFKVFNVYEIPLNLLTFNKYNGRIASDMMTYEKALGNDEGVNPHTEHGERIIRDMILASTVDKQSQETLRNRQKKIAIITEDGVIIDGNKRACLIKENLDKGDSEINFLRTVILPVSNLPPEKIEFYETLYQIGEEQKEDYNPINTYLKIRRMYLSKATSSNSETDAVAASIFNENQSVSNTIDTDNLDDNAIKYIVKKYGHYKTIEGVSGVKKALRVLNVMESYLRTIQCPETYRLLYGREEQFRGLEGWLSKYKDGQSTQCFSEFNDLDYENLKNLSFDYILARTTVDNFRNIAGKTQPNHIIGNKKSWDMFVEGWNEIFKDKSRDLKIDISPQNQKHVVENIVDAEKSFSAKFKPELDKNIESAMRLVRRAREDTRPTELINESIENINELLNDPAAIRTPEVQTLVANLINLAEPIIALNSLSSLKQIQRNLDNAVQLIAKEQDSLSDDDMVEAQNIAKSIQKTTYKIIKRNFDE